MFGRSWLTVAVAAALLFASSGFSFAQEEAPEPLEPEKVEPGGDSEAPGAKPEGAPERKSDLPVKIEGELVEITLRSGSTMEGVVQNRRIELQRGSIYVASDDTEAAGAGIRVFYSKGLNGFMFVPYEKIQDVRFLGPVTPEKSEDILEDMKLRQAAAEEIRLRAMAELQARKAARRAAEAEKARALRKAKEEGLAPPDPARDDKIKKLLEQFPPEEWKPDRLDDIRRRALITDIQPTAQEREFLSNYDLWMEGYMEWVKTSGQKDGAEDAPAK